VTKKASRKICERLQKRAAKLEKHLGRPPTVNELGCIKMLGWGERFIFFIVGLPLLVFAFSLTGELREASDILMVVLVGVPGSFLSYHALRGHPISARRLFPDAEAMPDLLEGNVDQEALEAAIRDSVATGNRGMFLIEFIIGLLLVVVEVMLVIVQVVAALLLGLLALLGGG
jgi:hypothetical protein